MAFLASVGAAVGGGASFLGTALGVVGTIFSGLAAKQAGDYQAKVADMNAKIAEENANRATLSAEEEQRQQDNLARGQLGEMEAGQGASGLLTSSPSFIRTRRASRELARLDALNIRQAGDVQAYGYRTDAVNQKAQGALAKAQGSNALLSSFIDAGSSLVGGAKGFGSPSSSLTARKTFYDRPGRRPGG